MEIKIFVKQIMKKNLLAEGHLRSALGFPTQVDFTCAQLRAL